MPSLTTLAIGQIGFVLVLGSLDLLICVAATVLACRSFAATGYLQATPLAGFVARIVLWGLETETLGSYWQELSLAVLAALLFAVSANPPVLAQYFEGCGQSIHPASSHAHGWRIAANALRLGDSLVAVPASGTGVSVGRLLLEAQTQRWAWRRELPVLLLVSVVATSYGWMFDHIVVLPAVIQMGVWTFH